MCCDSVVAGEVDRRPSNKPYIDGSTSLPHFDKRKTHLQFGFNRALFDCTFDSWNAPNIAFQGSCFLRYLCLCYICLICNHKEYSCCIVRVVVITSIVWHLYWIEYYTTIGVAQVPPGQHKLNNTPTPRATYTKSYLQQTSQDFPIQLQPVGTSISW